jgi:DNA-binding phage protein
MIRAAQERAARKRYRQIAAVLNEQSRRCFVALEAQCLGRGGVSVMARITELARSTIYHGLSDIRNNVTTPPGRIRKVRGGRRRGSKIQPY